MVHRDLKPANVLLASDGPRVIDFGISQAAEASALTRTGLVVGSPGFMSPEQAEGREVGPPSDIFSLGAVLAFAATGQGPFGTGSTPALVYRVVYSPPNLDHLPAEVRPLIERCLAKDPARRPTAAQLLAEAGAVHPATAGCRSPGWTRPGPTHAHDDRGRAVRAGGLSSPGASTRRQPAPDQPAQPAQARHARRRAWRPLAVVSLSVGLLAGCTFTGMALTSGSGHTFRRPRPRPRVGVCVHIRACDRHADHVGALRPSRRPRRRLRPSRATPGPSRRPRWRRDVTQSASPTVTAAPSASTSPTVITSTSAVPTVTVTSTGSAPATPVTPAVTTTATP